ncbi:hypothetical protein C0J45_16131 [Silurus meridionalis]|nr:hypothetical protein C0J45_16131 [Silurus meridionalis]
MMKCLYLLSVVFQMAAGCALFDKNLTEITQHKGRSVLLPCSCSDLHSKPQKFTWMTFRTGHWTEVLNDEHYRGRYQLFNNISPANLSLLISDLREEDEGDYMCSTEKEHRDITLYVKGCELVNKTVVEKVTGFIGESVVLPCSCTELQDDPKRVTWEFNKNNHFQEIYSKQTGHHSNRVKLVSKNPPGNLSLLITDLTEEDQGLYRCNEQYDSRDLSLSVKVRTRETSKQSRKPDTTPPPEQPQRKTTTSLPASSSTTEGGSVESSTEAEHQAVRHRDVILACMKRTTFLGMVWDSARLQARLSPARIEVILTAVKRVGAGQTLTVRQFQRLLGLMAAASSVISLGLLYMRTPPVVATGQRIFPQRESISYHQGLAACMEGPNVSVPRPHFRDSVSSRNANDGRFPHGVGSGHEWPLRPVSVERPTFLVAYKLPGDFGSVFGVETLSPGPKGPQCVGPHGQYCGGLVHQPPGGPLVSPLVQTGTRGPLVIPGQTPLIESRLHPGMVECQSRRTVETIAAMVRAPFPRLRCTENSLPGWSLSPPGCALSVKNNTEITQYKGGSVLLPCSCSDLHYKPQKFTWETFRTGPLTEVLNDEHYGGRYQLFNNISPANLSLLISDLREEDQGYYRCSTGLQEYKDIRLNVKGCELVKNTVVEEVTGFTGESVVLPCVCADLQNDPKRVTWKFNKNNHFQEIYSKQTGNHSNRVKLVSKNPPGTLSLLISDLTEEDQGFYRCSAQDDHRDLRLSVNVGRRETSTQSRKTDKTSPSEHPQSKTTTSPPASSSTTQVFGTVAVLLLVIPVVVAFICWRRKGRSGENMITEGCSDNKGNPEDQTVPDVTYSTGTHINTAGAARVQINDGEETENASIITN